MSKSWRTGNQRIAGHRDQEEVQDNEELLGAVVWMEVMKVTNVC